MTDPTADAAAAAAAEAATAAGAAAAAAAYFNAKPPPFAGPMGFRMWKTEVRVWQRLTNMAPASRAPTMVASMTGVAKRLALTLSEDDLFSEEGVTKLVALMESRFGGATGTSRVAAFNGMRACVRNTTSMEEYLVAFDEALALCVEAGCPVDDQTQANVVLHQASLTDMERMMVVSVASKGSQGSFTYGDVAAALLTLFGGTAKGKASALVTAPGGGPAAGPTRPSGGGGATGAGMCWYCNKKGHLKAECKLKAKHQRERGAASGTGGGQDATSPTETIHMMALAGTTGPTWSVPVGETILDPGATATVAGADWIHSFLAALPADRLCQVQRQDAAVQLKFGAGAPVGVTEQVVLPVRLAHRPFLVRAYVVPGSLPLLISRPTLTSLGASIDYADHTLTMEGGTVHLAVSSAGHHVFNALGDASATPILLAKEDYDSSDDEGTAQAVGQGRMAPAGGSAGVIGPSEVMRRVGPSGAHPVAAPLVGMPVVPMEAGGPRASSSPGAEPGGAQVGQTGAEAPGAAPTRKSPLLTADSPNLMTAAHKLHIQYSHVSAARLCALLRRQGCQDGAVHEAVRRVVADCAVCQRHGPVPSHAVVTVPETTAFNEAVAMDLFFLTGGIPVLHVIDMHTRYSKCVLLDDKSAATACNAFMAWVVTFGAPTRVLSDGGGEFDNDLWRLLGDRLGIEVDATAAQAPWSNGVCERHNAVVKRTFAKIQADEPGADPQLLLDTACLAKNSLLVHGAATPHQLMCGTLPRLPSLVTDSPPALSDGRVLGDNNLQQALRLLSSSRVAFIEAEADQSLRRALARKTRSPGVVNWARDAVVIYWHTGVSGGTSGWRGPARVGGQTGRQVLLRHGGKWLTRDTGAIVEALPEGAPVRGLGPAPDAASPDAGGTSAFVPAAGDASLGLASPVGPGPAPPPDDAAAAELTDDDVPALVPINDDEDEALDEACRAGDSSLRTPPVLDEATLTRLGAALARERAEHEAAMAAADAAGPIDTAAGSGAFAELTATPDVQLAGGEDDGVNELLPVPAATGTRRSRRGPHPVDRLGAEPPETQRDVEWEAMMVRCDEKLRSAFTRPPPDAPASPTAKCGAPAVTWAATGRWDCAAPVSVPSSSGASLHRPDPILLLARAGGEQIDAVLRVGEQPSAAVSQVLLSRSELRRRQEVPLALAGRRFDGAMRSELEAWMTHGVYEEVARAGQRVISTRWVLTEKPGELANDPPRRKARLVIRGFEDPHKKNVVSTSPTVSRASLRMLLAMLVVHDYVPRSVDVRTAFLQGMPIDRVDPVYVQPPPQARVPTDIVWRLRKCAYGLTDAPRWWYQSVCVVMDVLGYARAETDHGLFLSVKDGTLQFGLAVHVDDFLYGGTAAEVARFEAVLQDSFSVGPVAVGNLSFTGLRVRTDTNGATGALTMSVDQDHYLESIEEIDITPDRGATKEAAVTTGELTLYRRAVGALLWASGQTQPFMACAASMLARRFHQAVVHDLTAVNRVIGAARAAAGLPLLFTAVPGPHRLIVFTDASAISNSSATAQTGYLIFMSPDTTPRGELTPATPLQLIAWGSHRQRRVTHSSFAAETYALLDGMRAAVEVACVLTHLTHGAGSNLVPIDAVTDCLSLYNTMSAVGLIKPKEVNAGVEALREMYAATTMSSLTWVPAAGQVADPLTKASAATALRAVLRTGRYGLRPTGVMTKTHDTDRDALDARVDGGDAAPSAGGDAAHPDLVLD